MSGHSHAKTVAHVKEMAAAKRGAAFSKFGRLITIAAKEGGDPTVNAKLKAVIEQAKSVNMPKENIERAIKKGTGELAGENLEEVSYEAFGPGGIALIIEGITDNTNRTLTEVKVILNQNNGKMAGEGAVRWMFDRKGIIIVPSEGTRAQAEKDELEMLAIECGADDISWVDDILEIHTKPEDLNSVQKALEEKQIKIDSASFGFIAKEEVAVSEREKEQAEKLFEILEDNDAITSVSSNMKD